MITGFVPVVACLLGLIPESGPHLIFVAMFAEGIIPISTLPASSIVHVDALGNRASLDYLSGVIYIPPRMHDRLHEGLRYHPE